MGPAATAASRACAQPRAPLNAGTGQGDVERLGRSRDICKVEEERAALRSRLHTEGGGVRALRCPLWWLSARSRRGRPGVGLGGLSPVFFSFSSCAGFPPEPVFTGLAWS
jgi:hypothetical protein